MSILDDVRVFIRTCLHHKEHDRSHVVGEGLHAARLGLLEHVVLELKQRAGELAVVIVST